MHSVATVNVEAACAKWPRRWCRLQWARSQADSYESMNAFLCQYNVFMCAVRALFQLAFQEFKCRSNISASDRASSAMPGPPRSGCRTQDGEPRPPCLDRCAQAASPRPPCPCKLQANRTAPPPRPCLSGLIPAICKGKRRTRTTWAITYKPTVSRCRAADSSTADRDLRRAPSPPRPPATPRSGMPNPAASKLRLPPPIGGLDVRHEGGGGGRPLVPAVTGGSIFFPSLTRWPGGRVRPRLPHLRRILLLSLAAVRSRPAAGSSSC
jgi:hypothetical protein